MPVHLFFGEALTLEQRYDFWFVAQFAAHVHERISIEHAFARALRIERATPRIGSHRLGDLPMSGAPAILSSVKLAGKDR